MKIAIVNKSTVVSNTALAAAATAINSQINNHFSPVWDKTGSVYTKPSGVLKSDERLCLVTDDPTIPDALGYHDVDSQGRPVIFIFAKPTLADNIAISAVLSHEVLEALGNPWIDGVSLGTVRGQPEAVAYEVCDAVESDYYTINGLAVSNFVLPSWFDDKGKGPFDHLGKLKAPFTMTAGGYMIISHFVQQNWGEIYAATPDGFPKSLPASRRPNRYSRRTRYINRGR